MLEADDISVQLNTIIDAIFEEIEKNRANLNPTKKLFWKRKFENFNELGKNMSFSCETVAIDDWEIANINIFTILSKKRIYLETIDNIKRNYMSDGVLGLQIFVRKIISKILECNLTRESSFSDEINIFVKELENKDLEHEINIALMNLIVQKDFSFKIENMEIKFRKTKKEIMEKELLPHYAFEPELMEKSTYHTVPTSFLEIRYISQSNPHIYFTMNQLKDRIISILNLYKNWGINIGYYKVNSQSYCPMVNLHRVEKENKYYLPKYHINEDEIDGLLHFFNNMYCDFPTYLYNPLTNNATTNLSIAFERYNEAILSKDIVKKIFLAIAGIEGLLSQDNLEVTYKLSIRTAKLLSYFDMNPFTVKDIIKNAYGIRSKFVHGTIIKENDKIIKNFREKYGIDLSNSLLGILRLLLITYILGKKDKKDIISWIEDALMYKSTELDKMINVIKTKIPTISQDVFS
ncbi:MAG TPA: HEPN domain-containing protein [Candidatus Methanofastidiosa archaeon]|nr:HEPN domain-containing protein [Candidatus Methanofastidiosa archaeon]